MEGDFSLIFPLAQNGTDKRRLARAVRADQRDHLAAVHMQVDIVQDRLAADMDGQMLDFQAFLCRRSALGGGTLPYFLTASSADCPI